MRSTPYLRIRTMLLLGSVAFATGGCTVNTQALSSAKETVATTFAHPLAGLKQRQYICSRAIAASEGMYSGHILEVSHRKGECDDSEVIFFHGTAGKLTSKVRSAAVGQRVHITKSKQNLESWSVGKKITLFKERS